MDYYYWLTVIFKLKSKTKTLDKITIDGYLMLSLNYSYLFVVSWLADKIIAIKNTSIFKI